MGEVFFTEFFRDLNPKRPDPELNRDILTETSFRDSRSTVVPSGPKNLN
jgi:hypothetical protein